MNEIRKKDFKKTLYNRNVVYNGNNGKYSHLIIYCDHFDYSYCSRYVEKEEDIEEVIRNIKSGGSPGVFTIEEVYNYYLDLEEQLCNENNVLNIEPKFSEDMDNKKVDEIVETLNNKKETPFTDKLKEAILYADKIHKNKTRKGSDIPYINHPIKVMQYVLEYYDNDDLETKLIIAALHDVVEDSDNKKDVYCDIINKFGPKVSYGVLELTSDKTMQHEIGKEKYLSLKMADISDDSLIIKLCDRLSNVEDLESSNDPKFITKYRKETTGIFEYLINNRNLSDRHIRIIREIISKLLRMNIEDDIEERLIILLDKCKYKNELLEMEFLSFLNSTELEECSYVKRKN